MSNKFLPITGNLAIHSQGLRRPRRGVFPVDHPIGLHQLDHPEEERDHVGQLERDPFL